MKKNARRFNCARCHCQVIICSHCDRGNIYCNNQCAQFARAQSVSRAQKKYQPSRRGRFANAHRQQRFRQRQQEKVTHQGSASDNANVLLPKEMNTRANVSRQRQAAEKSSTHCHFCHGECDLFLRSAFIRRYARHP